MTRPFSAGQFVFVALVLAGCQGRFGPDNACETVQAAQCRFEFECCTGAERQRISSGGVSSQVATQEACFDLGTQLSPMCVQLGFVRDAVEAERFAYDEARAEECFGPLVDAANDCDAAAYAVAQQALFGLGPGCRGAPFFGEGVVEVDEVCQLDVECVDGRCDRSAVESDVITVDGICIAAPAIGERCEGFCGPNAFCPGFGAEGEGEGEGEGEPPPPPPPPVCTALLELGSRCNDSRECASNLCDIRDGQAECVDTATTSDLEFRICEG